MNSRKHSKTYANREDRQSPV